MGAHLASGNEPNVETEASASASLTRTRGRRFLRAFFYTGGVVATSAGLHTMIAGARSIVGERRANPSVESELRFYATFYVAYGLAALRVAPRADRERLNVLALAALLFLAGLVRAGAWLAAGRPHPFQIGLLAVELGAPPAILAAQARLGSAAP
jgi:uncharacterized protein DUF4345